MDKELRKAAEGLRARLVLWKTMAAMNREMGQESIELGTTELWEPADQAALAAFDSVLNQHKGLQALPFTQEVTQ